MSRASTVRRLAHALGVAVLTVASLAACGDEAATVKDAIDLADGRGSIDTDGDGVDDATIDADQGTDLTITTDEGEYAVTTELPDGFPTDVPLLDGTVLQASSLTSATERGWNVVLSSPLGFDETVTAVDTDLTGAGFTDNGRFAADGTATVTYTRDTLQVLVGITHDGTSSVVAYTVVVGQAP